MDSPISACLTHCVVWAVILVVSSKYNQSEGRMGDISNRKYIQQKRQFDSTKDEAMERKT